MSDSGFEAAFDALIGRVRVAAPIAVKKGALVLQQAGMSETAVVSGTLRRSWRMQSESGAGVYSAKVGPTTVYARRIELGFKDTDSIGRTYNQSPKPYVKPAFERALPAVKSSIRAAFAAALRG